MYVQIHVDPGLSIRFLWAIDRVLECRVLEYKHVRIEHSL